MLSIGAVVSDHYIRADCELVNHCSEDPNVISNINWNTAQVINSPTRLSTLASIPEFSYSNPDCPLLAYSLSNHDSSIISVAGSTITYNTNINEPFTLNFSLIVTA